MLFSHLTVNGSGGVFDKAYAKGNVCCHTPILKSNRSRRESFLQQEMAFKLEMWKDGCSDVYSTPSGRVLLILVAFGQ